jgi:hypothetical protein
MALNMANVLGIRMAHVYRSIDLEISHRAILEQQQHNERLLLHAENKVPCVSIEAMRTWSAFLGTLNQ